MKDTPVLYVTTFPRTERVEPTPRRWFHPTITVVALVGSVAWAAARPGGTEDPRKKRRARSARPA